MFSKPSQLLDNVSNVMFFPLFAPWIWFGLVASSLSHEDKEEDLVIIDRYLRPFSLELYDFPQTGRGIRT